MRALVSTVLATAMAVGLSSAAYAQVNTNTTIQEGRVNTNQSNQEGDDNDNATFQEGRDNANSNRQRGDINTNQTGQKGGGVNYNESDQQGRAPARRRRRN
jgi:minor curlin subunit